MNFWHNAAALLTVFHPETTPTGNHSHKDVKNEGRSDYMYENKARATKCHAKNAAFYTKMHPLHVNRQQSSGPFGRLCTNCATIRDEITPATVVTVLKKLRIGDQQPDATTKYTFADVKPYKANSPLLPSGLLGPVRIYSAATQ